MTKYLHTFIIISLSVTCYASSPDSSINIISEKNQYELVFNAAAHRVEVKEALNTRYISNRYQVNIPVAETYNNSISIDNVECRINDHKLKDFKPEYSYFTSNDIFYSDENVCHFKLTLPKKGSTADVTFTETINDPRYFTSIYFPDNLVVAHKEISLKIPRWMKVELKELNFRGYEITKNTIYDANADADIITYTAQNVPPFEQEDNSPGPTYIYPHILVLCKTATVGGYNFTYFNTLADQYRWYHELIKNSVNDKSVLLAKAKELTAGLVTDIDKIKAIFYYVQNNIRYIAFEDGMAGFRPEKADEVLRKKYGDCKGMANLTKALLVSLNYDARLCWLGTDHIAYDYQTPSMAVDNHMICGLTYQGKTMFLDATETYLGINEYAERIQGRQILMEDGDKYILTRVPLATDAQNYDFESSQLIINGTNIIGKISHLWKGEDKEMVLSAINSIKKEKADDALITFLSNNNSNYAIRDIVLSTTIDPDKDLSAVFTFDFKNAASLFSKSYYIDLDQKKELLNATINIADRKLDYWFYHKTNITKQTELTIPTGYKASYLPPGLEIKNPDYEFHISFTPLPGKIVYKKTILLKHTHLAVSKFEQWNKDIEQLIKAYNETIILKPITE